MGAGGATIFALASGQGQAGIAVIRISGPHAIAALRRLSTTPIVPRQLTHTCLTDPATGELLDLCLVATFPAPASYTGEDVVELHVHGGQVVIAGVLSRLGQMSGLRPAEPGEFTRRAFENGKLDLTEVEGLADLLAAETEAQRHQALTIASGNQRQVYDSWRGQVIAAMAHVEAELDFADEADVVPASLRQARATMAALHEEIGRHLADGHRGEIMREGFRVVLAGAPNVGKSSLLNALARRDVAIVSPEAGTTRDVIDVRLNLGGVSVLVSDTAGIRREAQGVEAEGIRRTMARGRAAELVVWIVDATYPETRVPAEIASAGVAVLPVLNKSDLLCQVRPPAGMPMETLRISARTGLGLDRLVQALAEAARSPIGLAETPAIITRARHREALLATRQSLGTFLTEPEHAAELRAEDLRSAAQALGRVTGRVDVEDVLDQLFATFCIGK